MRLLVILCVLALGFAGSAEAQRSMAKGLTSVELQSVGKRDRIARVQFPDGTRGERFILKAGDCPRVTGDCNADRERVEFFEGGRAPQPVGSEVWLAWSVMVDPSAPARPRTSMILGQFHQRGTSGPVILFQVIDGRYEIKMTDPYRLDDDPMNPIPDFRNIGLRPYSAMRGGWTRVMVNARWSRGEDGFIQVWLDGQPAWRYDGPTVNANDPVYFKYGVYRSFVSKCGGPCPDFVAYYRDVRRGKSRERVE